MDYDVEAKGVKRKTCSYCFVSGHTRKTCEYLKSDRSFLIEANLKYRRLMVEKFTDLGLCPGTLVDISGRGWHDDQRSYVDQDKLAMIKTIRWKDINFNSSLILEPSTKKAMAERVIIAELLSPEESHSLEVMTLPYDAELTPHYKMYESYAHNPDILWNTGHKMVSRISNYIVMSVVPSNFLSIEESTRFVDDWLSSDPYSKNKKKRRSRSQVRLHRFSSLMGKSKTLAQEEKVFYDERV